MHVKLGKLISFPDSPIYQGKLLRFTYRTYQGCWVKRFWPESESQSHLRAKNMVFHLDWLKQFLLALSIIATPSVIGEEIPDEVKVDQEFLQREGIQTDGPALIAFFQSRTPTPNDETRLAQRIEELGNTEFEVRERASLDLTRAGRFALPLLRPALKSRDFEVVRRARECIEQIEQTPHAALIASAARLAIRQKPDGAVEAMLRCLPWIEDEVAEEAIFHSLVNLGLADGVPHQALIDARTHRLALCRAAAGLTLGKASPEYRKMAMPLLEDADPQVRFRTARALVQAGEAQAMPAMLELLTDGSLSQAHQVEDILCTLAGEVMPVTPPQQWDSTHRKTYRSDWENWWAKNQEAVDFSRLGRQETMLGLNLIIELDGSGQQSWGQIWECGRGGTQRWKLDKVQRPIDAQLLPGGRLLIAEHGAPQVTERDREGRILWEHRTSSQPVSCKRLSNGNTFIVTYNELLEVTSDHKVVFSARRPTSVYYGEKLRNGHYLCVQSNNTVVELDQQGREIRSIPVGRTSGWASVEKLPNGHYLVALYSDHKVVEVDDSGKVFWEHKVPSPGHATRLPSGRILIASIEGKEIQEVDRSGKVIWSVKTEGRPFHAYRR